MVVVVVAAGGGGGDDFDVVVVSEMDGEPFIGVLMYTVFLINK